MKVVHHLPRVKKLPVNNIKDFTLSMAYVRLPKVTLFIVYTSFSVFLFLKVFDASNLVIDEEFHLRQGLHYCNGDFKVVRYFSTHLIKHTDE